MSDIYREYRKDCETSNPHQKPLSRFTFDLMIKDKNIGFQPPKKDRCDLCITHEVCNIVEELYQIHLRNKEKARQEKGNDKNEVAKGYCVVLTMDL